MDSIQERIDSTRNCCSETERLSKSLWSSCTRYME